MKMLVVFIRQRRMATENREKWNNRRILLLRAGRRVQLIPSGTQSVMFATKIASFFLIFLVRRWQVSHTVRVINYECGKMVEIYPNNSSECHFTRNNAKWDGTKNAIKTNENLKTIFKHEEGVLTTALYQQCKTSIENGWRATTSWFRNDKAENSFFLCSVRWFVQWTCAPPKRRTSGNMCRIWFGGKWFGVVRETPTNTINCSAWKAMKCTRSIFERFKFNRWRNHFIWLGFFVAFHRPPVTWIIFW